MINFNHFNPKNIKLDKKHIKAFPFTTTLDVKHQMIQSLYILI